MGCGYRPLITDNVRAMTTRSQAFVAAVLGVALLLAGCSAVQQLSTSRGFDPLPLRELEAQAATAEPAEWNLEPPRSWPSHVPAPSFIEFTEVDLEFSASDLEGLDPEEREFFENLDLPTGPGVSGPDGARFSDILTAQSRPSDDDVVAYMALLLSVGFEVDEQAASHGFFVRDDIEWVQITHLPLNDRARQGAEPGQVGGFKVAWHENPIRAAGYCRTVEVGGESCRE